MVTDLVTSARPQPTTFEPVHLANVIAAAADSLRSQLTHRQIDLSIDAPVDVRVMADAKRLSRALVNILTNAAEATRSGGAIRVALRSEGAVGVIEVADDGVGIDLALIDRVFDPFVSGKPDGIGLGLLNARSFAKARAF